MDTGKREGIFGEYKTQDEMEGIVGLSGVQFKKNES